MRQRKTIVSLGLLFAAVICLSGYVRAEETVPQEKPALYLDPSGGTKLGYVNMAELFNHSSSAKTAIQKIQNEIEEKQAPRKILTDDFDKFRKNGASKEVLAAQKDKITALDQEIEKWIEAREVEIFAPVFESLEAEVKAYGVKQAFKAIYAFPEKGAEDITDEILAVISKK